MGTSTKRGITIIRLELARADRAVFSRGSME